MATIIGVTAMATSDLRSVEDRFFEIRDFRLENGTVMPLVTIAYETCGHSAADGKNAVLITHGYTNGHHAAGRNPANNNQPGWWDGLIGLASGVEARYFEIDSELRHSASGPEDAKSSLVPREFLAPLMARPA